MAQRRNDSKRSDVTHESFSIVKARAALGELAIRAGYGNERIRLTRRGKLVAAIVSAADLAKLEGSAA